MVAAKTYFLAFELWVKKVGTCGVVLYRNQPAVTLCILLYCILVVLTDTKILCLENISSNVIKSKNFDVLQLFF